MDSKESRKSCTVAADVRLTCTGEEHREDSDGGSTSDENDNPVELLPQAQGSEISRQRSFSRSSKCKGKSHRIAGGPSTKVKRLSTHERAAAFLGEYLRDSMGSLYCDACQCCNGEEQHCCEPYLVRAPPGREGETRKGLCSRSYSISVMGIPPENT